MRVFSKTALAEAATIVGAATILGFVFTGITGRGVFRTSPAATTSTAEHTITSRFLTFEEARALHSQGRALFLDSRHAYDFSLGHIAGAVNVPLHDFDTTHPMLSTIPRNHILVVYCDGEECNSSVALAALLHNRGFANVNVYFGGWYDWRAHNQQTEP